MPAKPRTVGPIETLPGTREAYSVTSSDGRSKYLVKFEGSGDADPEYVAIWSCTCPAYEYHAGKPCKHINAVIEMIGNFARVLSLGMRLFGNIFGEHTATGIFMGMLPFVIPWPMMGLGIFGATLQAFVFIMMTMVYIGGAVAEEH